MDIQMLDDAWLKARAEVDEAIEKFERQFYEPLARMQMGAMLAKMTPEMRAQLEAENPEMAEALKKVSGNDGQA